MLLGRCALPDRNTQFAGTAVVIFQPAKRAGVVAGDIDDGLMDRFGIGEVYGMHNYPGMPLGTFGIRPADDGGGGCSDHRHRGAGAHAARPHFESIRPDGAQTLTPFSRSFRAISTL